MEALPPCVCFISSAKTWLESPTKRNIINTKQEKNVTLLLIAIPPLILSKETFLDNAAKPHSFRSLEQKGPFDILLEYCLLSGNDIEDFSHTL
jgi:hypothetical protein